MSETQGVPISPSIGATAATHGGCPPPAFGALLRAARVRRGISQAESGRRIGMHRTHVNHLEASRTVPSLPALARIAAALDLTDAELAALVRAAGDDRRDGGRTE